MTILSCFMLRVARSTSKDSLIRIKYISQSRKLFCTQSYDERDPAPLFFENDVQSLLKNLTRANLATVFRKKSYGVHALTPPSYKFMTSEELEIAMKEAGIKAEKALQMPPVVQVYTDIDIVLSEDPALKRFDTVRYVITDITYGLRNSDRIILTRDPDGSLKHANHDLRQRVNQTYFPVAGRKITLPKMFEEQYLKSLLDRNEYEYILNRACNQFDPDDKMYHNVTSLVYNHISENKQFDLLRSTRHFGPLVFYLCWNKSIDNLLLELIQSDFILDAVQTITLLYKIHPDCKSNSAKCDLLERIKVIQHSQSMDNCEYDLCSGFIGDYIKNDSTRRGQLELALQSHKELFRQKKIVSDGVKSAHGLSV